MKLVNMTPHALVSNAFRREGRSPLKPSQGKARQNEGVSNAFRREGRSPRLLWGFDNSQIIKVSNAFRREGRSPRDVSPSSVAVAGVRSPMPFGARGVRPRLDFRRGRQTRIRLQCLSARGAFAPKEQQNK